MGPQGQGATHDRQKLEKVVIRFAGDSGDGMQLTGDRFTSEAALFGNDLATQPNYPAEIRAPAGTLPGVSSFQIQIADYDILTAELDRACAITPGIESPTVSALRDASWSAVRAMVPSRDVHQVMDELYELGARGILVTDIHACRL